MSGSVRALRWRLFAAGLPVALVIGAVVACEALGWPFLAAPMQQWLAGTLERRVSLSADAAAPPRLSVHLLHGVEIAAPYLEIGAPAWSAAPNLVAARDVRLTFSYADLWRVRSGAPLRVRELRAARLDGWLERLADGRASWQIGADTASGTPTPLVITRLQVDAGAFTYRDAITGAELDARFSLVDDASGAAGSSALQMDATGSYRQFPATLGLRTHGALPLVADDPAATALPLTLVAHIGAAHFSFDGRATDALRLGGLQGRFSAQGPSLAALGDPLRVTLPTTGPFRAEGTLAKQGRVWNAVFDRIAVGSSRLAGALRYDPRPRVPLLTGHLSGSRLALADLGPAVGAPVRGATAAATPPTNAKPGRVLPDREFDLPSLRMMDADVALDIAKLDLGSHLLEPLEPLRTHLVLADGVLTLADLDARTGQGTLAGTVRLDGRDTRALWTADLRWDGVRLERWIHQARDDAAAPPYVTGRLNGRARVAGQGRSTAAILGSLHGGVRMHLLDGTISHLAVEAAGLDIAQGLGVLIKGDDALPIQCTVADLVAEQGRLRPRVLVLDTADSTLWIDGSLSLATEALDLRMVVEPKDFSPLALRTPLHLRGSFAQPSVSLDKTPLSARLGASAALALVNPLAALVPLFDIGSDEEAQRGAAACHALADRLAARH